MTPDRPPVPRPRTSPDVPPATVATVPESLYTLDPPAALDADLAALAPPARLHADAALWLALVNSLAHVGRLPARRRAAHLRRTRELWSAAAARWKEPRYASLGDRLARSRRPDPGLTLVREFLWALEQLESLGGVRLAYVGLTLVTNLVPADSRRAGYALAQSGRPLRTLGALDAALARYASGLRIGRARHDRWLRARSALGAGGVHTFRGNHPAARQAFAYVLRTMPANSVLAQSAHHGLILCTTAAGDLAGAIRHGWQAFRTRRADATTRAIALSLLADLSTRAGRHESALRTAQAALELTDLVRLRISFLRIALVAARTAGDRALTRRYAAELVTCIGTGGDLHEDAAGWLALAETHAARHERAAAESCLAAADHLAAACGYHQLAFKIDAARTALRHPTLGEPRRAWAATPPATADAPRTDAPDRAVLDPDATAVLDALAHLPTSAAELLLIV